METFIPCSLDEYGKPRLIDGEIERSVADEVTIRSADKKAVDQTQFSPPGMLYVTTHRILWASSERNLGYFNELSKLSQATDASRIGAVRIWLPFGRGAGVRAEFHSPKSGKMSKERTLAAIADSIQRAAWTKLSAKAAVPRGAVSAGPASTPAPPEPPQSQLPGAARRVNRSQADSKKHALVIDGGFKSLDALEKSAEDLVKLAARFRGLKAEPESDEQHHELLNMMADMCIDSPVTREVVGNDTKLYRRQLAIQLASYLPSAVVAVGGIMTVADAYCLINRVRATTEYVSPSDFTGALMHFKDGRVASRLTLFRFESGVTALKIDMTKEPGGIEKVAAMAEEDGRTSISALEVMQKRNIPVQTALELLESAEQAGLLVRDETTAGVRFFKNRFDGFLRAAAAAAAASGKATAV